MTSKVNRSQAPIKLSTPSKTIELCMCSSVMCVCKGWKDLEFEAELIDYTSPDYEKYTKPINVEALANRHRNCVAPCCSVRQDLIDCGIDPDVYAEHMMKAREELERKYWSELLPIVKPIFQYNRVELGECYSERVPLLLI